MGVESSDSKRKVSFLKDKDIAIILVYFGDKFKELETLGKKYTNVYIPKA